MGDTTLQVNISYNYEQTACREYLFVWKGREHVLVK